MNQKLKATMKKTCSLLINMIYKAISLDLLVIVDQENLSKIQKECHNHRIIDHLRVLVSVNLLEVMDLEKLEILHQSMSKRVKLFWKNMNSSRILADLLELLVKDSLQSVLLLTIKHDH